MSDLSIQGIWKPGNKHPTTPKNANSSRKSKNDKSSSKKENLQSKKTPGSSGSKRLSGSTMNMRFMKRKTDSNSAKRTNEKSKGSSSLEGENNEDTARNEMKEWRDKTPSHSGTSVDVHMSSAEDYNEHKLGMTIDESDVDRPGKATDADIYGVGAQIIGRRSFGGFNKVVQETWNTAFKEIERNNKTSKSKKGDDQLMKEYQQDLKRGQKRRR